MKNKQFLLFLLLPFTTYASGSEVILIFWFELIAIIISLIFIFTLNWKVKHKLILTVLYIVSLIYTNIVLGSIHHKYNIYFASTILSIIPISFLLIGFFIIRKKY
jgi:hypothetical protein